MAKNKTIGFVAPSGFVPDAAVIDRAARFFSDRGWHVHAGDTCFERQQRFAGPDDLRTMELQRFAADRSLDVVLAARGGYGLTRLLPRLDFAAIKKAGPTLCGYSDFTAFNLAYLARTGGVSFHGPGAIDFGAETPDPFTVEHFFAALENDSHAVEFDAEGPALDIRGKLWGGNLSLTCALLATPYFPRVHGGILFLEDVNEAAYSVERMLLHLLQASVLSTQKAILLGDFAPVPAQRNDNGYGLASAIEFIRSQCATPVVCGLPFGHVPRKATLPVGISADIEVRNGRATLSWTKP